MSRANLLRRAHPLCLLLTAMLTLWAGAPATVCGQNGTPGQNVTKQAPAVVVPKGVAQANSLPDGLMLRISNEVLSSGGYQPLRLSLIPTRPATQLRRFHLEVQVRDQYYHDTFTVAMDLDLPPGAKPADTVLRLPMLSAYYYCNVRVEEDGEHLPALDINTTFTGVYQPWAEQTPSMLFIAPGSRTVDTGGYFDEAMLGGNTHYWNNPPPTLNGRNQLPSVRSLELAELPRNWLDYSTYDMVCIDYADLLKLQKQAPESWQALRDWIRCGGNLCVFELGPNWNQLPQLEQLLGGIHTPVPATETDPLKRGWTKPPDHLELSDNDDMRNLVPEQMPAVNQQVPVPQPEPGRPNNNPPVVGHGLPCVGHPLDLGYVVASRHKQWFVGAQGESWVHVLGLLGENRYQWFRRNGVSAVRANNDFQEFLVPGAGRARVIEFQILITLFAILIGPVLYYWLRSQQRLHLLVLVVPAVSLTITAGLFAYALLADGLGTRIRVRSLTELDMQQGRAATWARLSYYTSLAPSSGLSFAGDRLVLPLRDEDEFDRPGQMRSMTWDDRQYLQRGWLNSRMPMQLLTQQAAASPARLEIQTEPNLTVTNHLGVPIEMLLVTDEKNNRFFVADLAVGATKPLEVADRQLSTWQAALRKAAPELPENYSSARHSGFFRSNYRYYYNQGNLSSPGQATGRLEQPLAELQLPNLPPRRFAAWCPTNPHVELGVAGTESGSSHIITGNW